MNGEESTRGMRISLTTAFRTHIVSLAIEKEIPSTEPSKMSIASSLNSKAAVTPYGASLSYPSPGVVSIL